MKETTRYYSVMVEAEIVKMSEYSVLNETTSEFPVSTPMGSSADGGGSVLKTVALITILVIIILMTIIGNTFVCLSPVVSHRLRTATYTFLVSLAVADLLLGITVLPFSAITAVTNDWPFGSAICLIYISCDVMFSTASILHLLVISFDRHYAITRPYAYQRRMNRKAALICIAAVWILSGLISFLPIHLGWNMNGDLNPGTCVFNATILFSLLDGILLFFVPLLVMFILYGRIVCIARRQAKAIRRLMINSTEAEDGARDRTNRRSIDEHKATKIIAIVLGCFMICWVPYFTIFTFKSQIPWSDDPVLLNVVLWLGYVNSLVNPLVYTLMIRDFRNAFKRILAVCLCAENGKRCMWLNTRNSGKSTFSATYAHNSTHPEATNVDQSRNKNSQFSLKPNGFYTKILRMSTSTVQVESQGV